MENNINVLINIKMGTIVITVSNANLEDAPDIHLDQIFATSAYLIYLILIQEVKKRQITVRLTNIVLLTI